MNRKKSSSQQRRRLVKAFAALVVLTLAIGVYVPSLDSPFQFDDALFLQDDNVRGARWLEFVWPPQPRLLTWLSFLGQYRLHGPNPVPFHAFNAIVHGLNSALALLVLSLLPTWIRRRTSTQHLNKPLGLAFFGALIFALHPLQTEAVVYVYQRSTLLGSFFAFLALLVWIKRPERDSGHWGGAAAALFLLSLGCKEAFASLPAGLWAYDGICRRDWKPDRWLWVMLAAAVVFPAAYLAWGDVRLSPSLLYAATQVKVWLRYLLLALGIASQSADHAVAPQTSLREPVWWWSLIGLTALAVWAWRTRRTYRAPAFWLAWMALTLAPTSSFISSPDLMFEHRMYAPMLGVGGLAAVLLGVLMERAESLRPGLVSVLARRLPIAVAAAALVLCATANLRRQKVWSSPRALWADAAAKAPQKYRPNFNLGVVLMEKSPRRAEQFLTRAIQLEPSIPLAYRSLGKVKFDAGELDAAESLWRQALKLDPSDAETWTALGVVLARRRDYAGAEEKFKEASRLSPYSAEPRLQLARLNLQFGFVEKAIAEAEAGLQHNPSDARLLSSLADAVSQNANWIRAAELYQRGLQSNPNDANAWIGLGRALWKSGRPEEGAAALKKGLETANGAVLRQRVLRLLDQIEASTPRR